MKEFRSAAKSSSRAKMRAMTGGNTGKSPMIDSGQRVEKQKVPTRAFGGLVRDDPYNRNDPNRFNQAQIERREDRQDARQQLRLDRAPRPGIGGPHGDPIDGLPQTGGLHGGPFMGNLGRPMISNPTPIGGPMISNPTPIMGRGFEGGQPIVGGGGDRVIGPGPSGTMGVQPQGMGMNRPGMLRGALGYKKGGAVKMAAKKPAEKAAKPFAPGKPFAKGGVVMKAGAGSGLGRLEATAAQKKRGK